MIVSCEASSKFHRTRFQNECFARCFQQLSKRKLAKWSFRARLPANFVEKVSKMIVSCEASSKFHRTRFQNECFARCFQQFSQKKLAKWLFRARLPPNFIEKLPKWSFRTRLPANFIEQSFQNDRFLRGFLEISQNKIPKRVFCAMLPTTFREKAYKIMVSREASYNFDIRSFQNDRFLRGHKTMLPKHNQWQPEANARSNS